jgi:hypothetical protein
MLKNSTLPFWFFTIAAILILIVSQLIQDGAFMDGMLYVSVSKNLADGIGTFWDPSFCKTQSSFHEQPPLYFGILALFYKVLGGSMYVERLFCFTCFAITGVFIHKLWKKIYADEPAIQRNSWFPILLWVIIPICFWAYTNFVEEVLMGLFVLIAMFYMFVALFQKKKMILNLIVAGVFIFLASLTKGIQGTFPIVSVGVYWLITKKISVKKMFAYTSILVGVPILLYAVLILTNNDVIPSYEKYFESRITGTFNHINDTTNNRLEIFTQILWQLLPSACVCAIVLFFTKKIAVPIDHKSRYNSIALWFIIIGLAGSLPLMVTLEQRTFYLVTSLSLFAIALAMWVAPNLSNAVSKINIQNKYFKIFRFVSILLVAASLTYTVTRIGKKKRDSNMLADVYTLGKIIPRGSIIRIPAPMCYDHSFKEYLIRYFYISSDASPAIHEYMVCRKNLSKELVPSDYKPYGLETKEFDLYILMDNKSNK